MDSQQLLAHFVERDRPYVQLIGQILDILLWNLDDLPWFLNNALRLWRDSPAVAVKCFQIIPKTKSPEAVCKYSTLSFRRGTLFMLPAKRNQGGCSQLVMTKTLISTSAADRIKRSNRNQGVFISKMHWGKYDFYLKASSTLLLADLVLETIIGQVYKAVKRHNDRLEEDKGAILSMKREAQINNAVEMAGTIWGSTVLLLAQVHSNLSLSSPPALVILQ